MRSSGLRPVLLILILVSHFFNSSSQNPVVDSLKNILKSAPRDTNRAKALIMLLNNTLDDKEVIKLNAETKSLAADLQKSNKPEVKLVGRKAEAFAIGTEGFILLNNSESEKALDFFIRAIAIMEETKDLKNLANQYNNVGLVKYNLGNIPEALKWYDKALAIQEKINDLEGLGGGLFNTGIIHQKQGNTPQALENYNKALKIFEKMNHGIGITRCLITLGEIYAEQGDSHKGIDYYKKAGEVGLKWGDIDGLAIVYNDLEFEYEKLGERK